MELIPLHPEAVTQLPQLSPEHASANAANSPRRWSGAEDRVTDINSLAAEVAGQIAAVHPGGANIELDLCGSVPELQVSPDTVGFILSGVIVNQLSSFEDEEGVVRIASRVQDNTIKLSVLVNGVPALRSIRAVDDDQCGEQDPTMANCRRLLEDQGGWIDLRDKEGFVGFELSIPALPLCQPVFSKQAGTQAEDERATLSVAS